MWLRYVCLILLLSLLVAPAAGAQPSYEVVHAFSEGPKHPYAGLIEASDGLLYGTTSDGGEFGLGAVFSVERRVTGALRVRTVHSFNGLDGARPLGGVIEADGGLYGTTEHGGMDEHGTVFRMTPAGAVTTIHSFDGTDGSRPLQLMRARDGNFYGMTQDVVQLGITRGTGTIYKIAPDGTFSLLHILSPDLTNLAEGAAPMGALVQGTDGNLYGTTSSGGRDARLPLGTIFRITPAGELTTLHTFSAERFNQPLGELVLGRDGNFYGTVLQFFAGSASTPGAVFRMTVSGDVTFLHTFTLAESTTGTGTVLLQADDDSFYVGTRDALFRMTPAGAFTCLHTFSTTEGREARGVMVGRDGLIYGVTSFAGLTDRGAVFRMAPGGSLTSLNPFIVDDAPLYPIGRLVPTDDGSGSLYGTSCLGGLLNAGAIFRISPMGTVTTLHSFAFLDGSCPVALTRATDGQYYGVAMSGGPANLGTIFRMAPTGVLSVLRTFVGADGASPTGLLQAGDGAFYGTARGGGTYGSGVVFKTTASGMFTVLHSFTGSGGEGCLPLGEPVQGADGNFYGTTTYCGQGSYPGEGTLFRMTPAGAVTTIRSGGFGGHPTPLLLANDGRLYGAAASSLFVATAAGDVTTLHVFTPADGDRALFPPIQAADGNLYGLTFGSFDSAQGTAPGSLYQATTAGAATVLHTFTPTTGHRPYGTLTQGNDGALYGTTLLGGSGQRGVVFRLTSTP